MLRRCLPALFVAFALVLVAILVLGCRKKQPAAAGDKPAVPAAKDAEKAATPSAKEKERAKGEEVMAKFPDATEPPVKWSWDPKTRIDPKSIPDEPVAGVMEGKLFTVKHVVLMEDPEDKCWSMRFYDIAPPAGQEQEYYFSADRYVDLAIPKAGPDATVDLPVTYADWGVDKAWLWYQTPRVDHPDGFSAQPGERALYIQFTEWTKTEPKEGEAAIGSAKGKIGCGGGSGEESCWIAGKFEALIRKPFGT